MPAPASDLALPLSPASGAEQAAELKRRWRLSRTRSGAPPYFEDLMLDGLGAIDDRVALLARAGADWQICRLGRAAADCLVGGGRATRLAELAPDCGFALARAAEQANRDGEPRQREAYFARLGHAQRYDLLALPLANRWGPPLVAIHLAEQGPRYDLVDAVFHASDDGVMALAVIQDDARQPTDFQIVDLNAAAAKLLGAPAERLRWRRLGEEGLGVAAAPLAGGLRRLIAARGERERFELTLAEERTSRCVGVNLTRMGDLFCATLTDLTSLKRREESYRLLFEANPMPMWIVSAADRRFLAVNDAAVEHFGYSRERFLAMTADELGGETAEAHAAGAGRAGLHVRCRRANGEPIDALAFARSVAYAGEAAELTAIVDITERKRAEAEAAYLGRHDALTGLSNRADFRDRVVNAIEADRSGGRKLAICCIDLDLFKDVNDTYGHPTGDRLLRMVAQRLGGTLGAQDFAARLGGDEFAVVFDPVEAPEAIEATVARMVEALSQPYPIDGVEVLIGASAGVALFPADGATADELTKNADLALYQAKADGGRGHRFFQKDLQRAALERRELEADLRGALAERQLELHYQPLIDICGRRVTGFEALLRWRHPTRGMIAPNDFIPIAEANGLIVPIGEWVLRTACADAANWPARDRRRRQPLADSVRRRQPDPDGHIRARPVGPRAASGSSSKSPRARCWPTPPRPPRRCTPCVGSASASPSTISAPAIRASATCAAFRSTRSRSTARSSKIWPSGAIARRSSRRSRASRAASASPPRPKGSRPPSSSTSCGRRAAPRPKASCSARRGRAPTSPRCSGG